MSALASLEKGGGEGEGKAIKSTLKWVKYDQSSECLRIQDSSVSYASAYVVF